MAAGGLEGSRGFQEGEAGLECQTRDQEDTLIMLPDAGQEGREPGPRSRSSWAAS